MLAVLILLGLLSVGKSSGSTSVLLPLVSVHADIVLVAGVLKVGVLIKTTSIAAREEVGGSSVLGVLILPALVSVAWSSGFTSMFPRLVSVPSMYSWGFKHGGL